jgi:glutamate 5-kinase
VACVDNHGRECARGLSNYSSGDTKRIMGQPSQKIVDILGQIDESELIHRDNLVVLNTAPDNNSQPLTLGNPR